MIQAMKNERGIALVAMIMMMAILLTISSAALLMSSVNLKTASNFKLGTMTLQAADAGVQQALTAITWGTIFQYSPINPTTLCLKSNPCVTSDSISSGYSYTVTVKNDANSPGSNTRAILTSTATGPNNSKKVIVAYVRRGFGGGPGAIYLPGDGRNIETFFAGDNFIVNGNDTNYDGTSGPEGSRLGISTTDQALVTEITDSDASNGGLNADQMNNVTGAGGYPSVGKIAPLDSTVTALADTFLGFPGVVELTGDSFQNAAWGTDASPQITHVIPEACKGTSGTCNDTIHIGGGSNNHITGSGVLVIDGKVIFDGDVDFHGLIIARGKVSIELTGSVVVHGSVFVSEPPACSSPSQQVCPDSDYELDIRGHTQVYYSSQALKMVDNNWNNTLPQPATLVAWQEMM